MILGNSLQVVDMRDLRDGDEGCNLFIQKQKIAFYLIFSHWVGFVPSLRHPAGSFSPSSHPSSESGREGSCSSGVRHSQATEVPLSGRPQASEQHRVADVGELRDSH